MKIQRQPKGFQPVIITLETEDEVQALQDIIDGESSHHTEKLTKKICSFFNRDEES